MATSGTIGENQGPAAGLPPWRPGATRSCSPWRRQSLVALRDEERSVETVKKTADDQALHELETLDRSCLQEAGRDASPWQSRRMCLSQRSQLRDRSSAGRTALDARLPSPANQLKGPVCEVKGKERSAGPPSRPPAGPLAGVTATHERPCTMSGARSRHPCARGEPARTGKGARKMRMGGATSAWRAGEAWQTVSRKRETTRPAVVRSGTCRDEAKVRERGRLAMG